MVRFDAINEKCDRKKHNILGTQRVIREPSKITIFVILAYFYYQNLCKNGWNFAEKSKNQIWPESYPDILRWFPLSKMEFLPKRIHFQPHMGKKATNEGAFRFWLPVCPHVDFWPRVEVGLEGQLKQHLLRFWVPRCFWVPKMIVKLSISALRMNLYFE